MNGAGFDERFSAVMFELITLSEENRRGKSRSPMVEIAPEQVASIGPDSGKPMRRTKSGVNADFL